MLTVKNVVRSMNEAPINENGRETVYLWEALHVHVEFNPSTQKLNLHFESPNGVGCTIDSGIVYVMNANGKTVDTYRLAGSEAL